MKVQVFLKIMIFKKASELRYYPILNHHPEIAIHTKRVCISFCCLQSPIEVVS